MDLCGFCWVFTHGSPFNVNSSDHELQMLQLLSRSQRSQQGREFDSQSKSQIEKIYAQR